jgi:hypothetical protein
MLWPLFLWILGKAGQECFPSTNSYRWLSNWQASLEQTGRDVSSLGRIENGVVAQVTNFHV